ncbi:MAG: dihydroorotase [Candidatus Cloacimonadota bacterium]|nr:dihydroorotase [Candidatus Cloacimonadota bacterium]
MKTIIKNGNVFIKGNFEVKDIVVENEKITKIGKNLKTNADKVIDAVDKHILPGFVDLHVHLRDPGQTHKEDIVSGTKAAAKGGFTTICAMPNTKPVIDNVATMDYIKRKAKDLGSCKVEIIGALTKKSEGKELAEIGSMFDHGVIAVSDDGHCVQNSKLMLNALKYVSNFNIPVIIHAEDYSLAGSGQINGGRMSTKLGLSGISGLSEEIIIARDIMLSESAKCKIHIAHISTKKGVELVRNAKKKGLNVTAEVTPHHLLLNDELTATFDPNTKMKPPLRSEKDRLACIEGIKDGTIDFIATDHAPHADFEKAREFSYAPFGIIGLETAFATLYEKLVLADIISLEKLVELLAVNSGKFINKEKDLIENADANFNIVDLKSKVKFVEDSLASKAKNTPFIEQEFYGKIEYTFCEGKITWEAK